MKLAFSREIERSRPDGGTALSPGGGSGGYIPMRFIKELGIDRIGLVFALACSLAVAGCSNSVTLSPQAQATEAQILAEICPVVADAAPYVGQFNGNVQKAYQTVSLACPPNSPPNNLVVALADLQAAYSILQPVVTGLLAKKH